MNKIHVTAKRDFVRSLTTASPVSALEELIWNGFDAMSDRVQVFLDTNELGGLRSIRVQDYGHGINHTDLKNLFGNLGDSWKKGKNRLNGRTLHGKNGKGRFKSFALGDIVEWNTSYKDENGKIKTYRITGTSAEIDDFTVSDPIESNVVQVGTEVTISNLNEKSYVLLNSKIRQELTKKFAIYLTEFPALTLIHDGFKINPAEFISHRKEYVLDEINIGNTRKINVEMTVIEWKIKTERVLLFCDEKGITLHEMLVGQQIRAPGFNFTVYIKTHFFRKLDEQNQLTLEAMISKTCRSASSTGPISIFSS
ncbi:MAG TPA: ATP-binding protein [Chitinispirillaceae bacterium]|nr:ATP-binding protein [Chitinispirillaceae bacterium]